MNGAENRNVLVAKVCPAPSQVASFLVAKEAAVEVVGSLKKHSSCFVTMQHWCMAKNSIVWQLHSWLYDCCCDLGNVVV